MHLGLEGKVVLVTGSTAGIGYATAAQFLREGATVFINGRSAGRVQEAAERLKATTGNTQVHGIAADFSQPADIAALLQQLPAVDILINNVGIFQPKAFTDIPDEDWFRFFEVNVLSGVRLARHYLPGMLQKNWGRIVFISSESALNIPEEMIHYGMTKTAQLAVSRGLAELTRGTSVTVNSVLPGPTSSEGVGQFVEELAASRNIPVAQAEAEFFRTARPTSILQRFTTPEEIANLVVYTASEAAAATNGAALRADGGTARFVI